MLQVRNALVTFDYVIFALLCESAIRSMIQSTDRPITSAGGISQLLYIFWLTGPDPNSLSNLDKFEKSSGQGQATVALTQFVLVQSMYKLTRNISNH